MRSQLQRFGELVSRVSTLEWQRTGHVAQRKDEDSARGESLFERSLESLGKILHKFGACTKLLNTHPNK